MKITAVVPAKATSTRLENKNLFRINGRTLVERACERLLSSEVIDTVYLDTESPVIEEACCHLKARGLKVLRRPAVLATNDVGANDMMIYALHMIDDCDLLVQSFSTTPLLRSETIDRVLRTFLASKGYDSFFTTMKMQEYFWNEDGKPLNFDPAVLPNSFQLEPMMMENHCLYGIYTKDLIQTKTRIGKKPLQIQMPKIESFDIDDHEDLEICKNLILSLEEREEMWS